MTDSTSRRGWNSALGSDFAADLRYAARALMSAPGFTIAAVVTLAIGIGANTAIFSAVDGVLLKPLPFSQPDRIVTVFQNDRKKGVPHDDVAPGNFVDWRERNTTSPDSRPPNHSHSTILAPTARSRSTTGT